MLSILRAVILYGTFTTLQILLRAVPLVRRMAVSLNLLFLLSALRLCLGAQLAALHRLVYDTVAAALLITAAYVGLRLADLLLLDALPRWRRRRAVPVVIRDMTRLAVFAVAVFFILRTVFPTLNLNFLAISSIVVGYVLGNATQDTLGNLIAGVALNAEPPFAIGDWIHIGDKTGQVVDMTWRATCIRTKTQDHVVIPNGEIAKAVIVNYSRPAPLHIVVSKIGLSYDAPPAKVRRVILEALREVPDVALTPAPRVECSEFGDSSIHYLIKYGITDFEHLTTIESRVNDLLWYRFKRESLVIPFPIRTVHLQTVTPESERTQAVERQTSCRDLLGRVSLFTALTDAERTRLAEEAREQTFTVNEVLVREGEEGSTFFVIVSGRVSVTVAGPQGEVPLAELAPGDFFGEMSLLTGEKRKATVTAREDTTVLVLAHTALAPLMAGNRGLAEQFAVALEKRLGEIGSRTREASEVAARQTPASRGMLVDRIRRYFRI